MGNALCRAAIEAHTRHRFQLIQQALTQGDDRGLFCRERRCRQGERGAQLTLPVPGVAARE